jgi:hypothetical protein
VKLNINQMLCFLPALPFMKIRGVTNTWQAWLEILAATNYGGKLLDVFWASLLQGDVIFGSKRIHGVAVKENSKCRYKHSFSL